MRYRMLMLSLMLACAGCADQALPVAPEQADLRTGTLITKRLSYAIKDLGVLKGGTLSGATDLNADGVVVGYADIDDGSYRAFRWEKGSGMMNLGTLGTFPNSWANGINRGGTVVGRAYGVDEARAVAWLPNGAIVDLGHLDAPGHTVATAINDWGVVVGYSLRDIDPGEHISIVTTHAFRMLPDGSKIALSPNLDQSFAYDINNSGMIVGAAGPVGSEHAHVWTLAGGATDIGTLGGAWAIAYGISDNHVVVGVSETAAAEVHGFRWTAGGGMVDLGLANDNWGAEDVNAFGRIVGNRTGGVMDGSHGYTRLPSGFTFLHGLVPQGDRRARAVNRCGWIAGNATSSSGTAHAVLWTKPVCD